jgi:hypothetical protein
MTEELSNLSKPSLANERSSFIEKIKGHLLNKEVVDLLAEAQNKLHLPEGYTSVEVADKLFSKLISESDTSLPTTEDLANIYTRLQESLKQAPETPKKMKIGNLFKKILNLPGIIKNAYAEHKKKAQSKRSQKTEEEFTEQMESSPPPKKLHETQARIKNIVKEAEDEWSADTSEIDDLKK